MFACCSLNLEKMEMDQDHSAKSDTWRRGLEVRRQVLGDEYVDRAFSSADSFSGDLQDYITEHAWGATWVRPGLSLKTRSIINLAMLVALNRPHELELHMRGAFRNGVTLDEMKEILLHTGVYCGAPAAVDAFRTARKVLETMQAAREETRSAE
jgi:4-carboxymuconolactone decarboxylase